MTDMAVEARSEVAARLSNLGEFSVADLSYYHGIARVEPFYPTANDLRLASAYAEAVDSLPAPSEGKTGITLMVGNGGFETAASMLPPELPILLVDHNPRTLFIQQLVKGLIERGTDPEEFIEVSHAVVRPFVDAAYRLDHAYSEARTAWNATGNIPHFLSGSDSFRQAADSLATRQIGYRHMDLSSNDDLDALSVDLGEVNAEIILANVTNVFFKSHAGVKAAREFTARLPLHPKAVIMDSNHYKMRSQVSDLATWRSRYAA